MKIKRDYVYVCVCMCVYVCISATELMMFDSSC